MAHRRVSARRDPQGETFEQVAREALELDDRAQRLALAEHVRGEHSWRRRCEAILELL